MKYQQEDKQEKLDPNWPKWKYHQSGKSKLVKSKKEEQWLGSAWKDSPAEHGTCTYEASDEQKAREQFGEEPEFDPDAEEKDEMDHADPSAVDVPKKGRGSKKG